MLLRFRKPTRLWVAFAWAGLILALHAAPAHGQLFHGDRRCPPAPCPAPWYQPSPSPELIPSAPSAAPSVTPTQPQATVPELPRPAGPETPAAEPSLAGGTAFAARGETVSLSETGTAYIDNAVPGNVIRLRVDAAFNDRRPDRAEFFYGKCGCFATLPPGTPGFDPSAPGPPMPELSVDYQEISAYLETLITPRLSAFVEVPVRFINPDINANESGIGDMNAGAKFAFLSTSDLVASFQFRTYIPTGDAFRGLGTDHVSLEPALLVFGRLSDRMRLEGELRDWIPVNGTDFAGNILRYGIGFSYDAVRTDRYRLTPVVEFVGWSVLSGQEVAVRQFDPTVGLPSLLATVKDAAGDTIVNAKVGLRLGFSGGDIYAGYGRALTGSVWYEDIYRLEFRLFY